jgi:peroxiredoxin
LREAPHLARLYADLHPQGLELFAVAMSYDPPNRVLETARQLNMSYRVSLDLDGTLARAFGNVELTPANFLVNADGKIVLSKTGALDFEALRSSIKADT